MKKFINCSKNFRFQVFRPRLNIRQLEIQDLSRHFKITGFLASYMFDITFLRYNQIALSGRHYYENKKNKQRISLLEQVS